MSREDILKNKFEFISYEKYRDAKHINRFLLMLSSDKHKFFENLFNQQKNDCFLLDGSIFYVSDGKKTYAFKLDDDFEKFFKDMRETNAILFNISFVFPDSKDIYDFSFINKTC